MNKELKVLVDQILEKIYTPNGSFTKDEMTKEYAEQITTLDCQWLVDYLIAAGHKDLVKKIDYYIMEFMI